jgi:hypothetical protein
VVEIPPRSGRTPSALCAIDEPGTRPALRSYLLRSVGLVGIGIAGIALGTAIISIWYPDGNFPGPVSEVLGFLLVVGVIVFTSGLAAGIYGLRISVAMRRHPWVAWPIRYQSLILNRSWLILGGDTGKVVTFLAYRWRAERFAGVSEIWLAGPPDRGCAVSVPGGIFLAYAHRRRTRAVRRWLSKSRPNAASL